MRSVALVAALIACGGGKGGDVPTTPTYTSGDTGTYTGPGFDCATDIPTLPLQVTDRIGGFTGAEDFAFDDDGHYVATDSYGNLVRIRMNGSTEVWSPNLGETAGTAFLSDGTLAISNVSAGQVTHVRANGSTEALITGLSYPNGLVVGPGDVVYVADQNLGEVFAYDTATDELTSIASGLFNPNGLALSPDKQTLYVGSFGGGTVHAIDLVNGGFELFGETPSGGTTPAGGCASLNEGDECFQDFIGLGECDAAGECLLALDEDACYGGSTGSPCQTDTLGQVNDSVCTPHPTGVLFCPEVPGEVVSACFGKSENDPCTAMSVDRECRTNWEGILVCDITSWYPTSIDACSGLASGDPCIILDYEGYADGTCADDPYGPDLVCDPGWGGGYYTFNGGLDGVQVDVCGYVWVTEYTLGYVWRFPPEGGEPELAVETGTFWIPNMHWGNGEGGWDADTMYMQDRFTDELLVIPIGLPGAEWL